MMIIENCKHKYKDKDLFGWNSEDQQYAMMIFQFNFQRFACKFLPSSRSAEFLKILDKCCLGKSFPEMLR